MQVCYYALIPITVGDEVRQEGDLIPEASTWRHKSLYLTEGRIAPVLVATLPKATQEKLKQWEEDQELAALVAADDNVEVTV
jgi:hypothetical protein